MKVTSSNGAGLQNELARLERKKIDEHEDRVKRTQEAYKKQLENIHEVGQDNLETKKRENEAKLNALSQDYQDRLEKLRQNLTSTQKQLVEEKSNLLESQDKALSDAAKDFETDSMILKRRNEEINAENVQSFQNAQKHLTKEYNTRLSMAKSQGDMDLVEFRNKNLRELEDKKMNFEQIHYLQDMKFSKALLEQKRQQEENLKHSEKMLAKELEALTEDHKAKYKNQVDNFEEKMEQSKVDFDKKFAEINASFERDLNLLTQRNQKKIDGLKKSLIENETLFTSRIDDPFYHPEDLRPTVVDQKDHYLVSLEVPPHEKDMIFVSGHGREIRIIKSRDFSDSTVKDDGSVNKYNRAETYSKTFNVPDIINHRKLTKEYQDGVLTFKILKA